MTTKADITMLESNLEKLAGRDKLFAIDLIGAFYRYGSLTPKQSPWVTTLIARANGAAPAPTPITLGSFSNVVALFAKAKVHLKYPKITLSCNGAPVILSVAGPASKNPGTINVTGEGHYPNRPWYGSITPGGDWKPSAQIDRDATLKAALQSLFQEFGCDPAGVARKYGLLTGNCCFCNSALSDERSTAAGFGPVCAEHYDLKTEWKAAAATSAQSSHLDRTGGSLNGFDKGD